MPLADSSRAIGAVTGLLTQRIELLTGHNVTVGRPEPPSTNGAGITNPRLNLFLYEAVFDPNLRNTSLDEGQDAPLWLVVRFLMTPFDDLGESDTADAYRVLGDGLRALQSLALLPVAGLQPEDQAALDPNPQQLRLTFNEAPSSLLSALMQGTDEKYRFSMCFEVRPLMIAPAAPAAYSLLIGVDYTGAPGAEAANGGVGLSVEPTLGPVIDRVTPSSFKAGDQPVRIDGTDLDIGEFEVQLGPVMLPLTLDAARKAVFDPTRAVLSGTAISAASHPLKVVRTLSTGRRRSSNIAVVNLLPELDAAAFDQGQIDLQGFHLGTDDDDVIVGLYRNGATVRSYDDVVDAAGFPPAQTHRRVVLAPSALPGGAYRVVLRVNGQQARQSPEVTLP
jgi:Pvc16 N-terminal domain